MHIQKYLQVNYQTLLKMINNSFFRRAKRALTDPKHDLDLLLNVTANCWPDETFIKMKFRLKCGKPLNLKAPQTFNEKQNWLKLYDRNPLYTNLVDKYRVKAHVARIIGDEYVVPCYGFWENVDDIDYKSLPQQFVLKCNHNSGGICICRDKKNINIAAFKDRLQGKLNENFYKYSRVWPYKNVKKGVLADMFLDDHMGSELRDYKWWCFNGEPKVMYCTNKGEDVYENFYDMDFNPLDISHGFRRFEPEIEKPAEFELMKELAAKLSAGIPFVRIDFFDVEGHVYFGEFTFCDWGGMLPLSDEWENRLGSWITLPKK